MVKVPACVALSPLNQGKGSIVLDLGRSTLLKAMGRTCGKWQQFGFGNLEYSMTGCVAKLAITTEKRGNTTEVLSNLSIIYTSCMLKGGKCAKNKNNNKEKLNPL